MLVTCNCESKLGWCQKKKFSFCNTIKNNKTDLKKSILSNSYEQSLLLKSLTLLKLGFAIIFPKAFSISLNFLKVLPI